MNGPTDTSIAPPRLAHLYARSGRGTEAERLLERALRSQAEGTFLVLVAPVGGEMHARARRVGLRVLTFETGFWARRQLAMDLQEFSLTRLVAHDPLAFAMGKWLRRRLGIPLAPPAEASPAP